MWKMCITLDAPPFFPLPLQQGLFPDRTREGIILSTAVEEARVRIFPEDSA